MPTRRTWKCEVCGYIHHGSEPPSTCPVCGVGPELFSHFEVVVMARGPDRIPGLRCAICGHLHHQGARPDACPRCGAQGSHFEPFEEGTAESTAAMDGQRLLIIGAGVAGLTAAEQARKVAAGADIALINREEGLPYYRINLTRYLAGEIGRRELPMQPMDWYQLHGIELVRGEAHELDRQKRTVRLRDGRVMAYDRLILANGAHAFVPPIPGVNREGILVARSLADADRILKRAEVSRHCVCVGGGLLGLEIAGALARRGVEVTVLEGFDWLLPRQLARPAGLMLQEHLEGLGLKVRCGVKVEEMAGDEVVSGVCLQGGEVLPADMVVLAAGVRPNSYLARLCGLKVRSGIIVDDRMETSDPLIHAAGDVAEHRSLVYGIWPAAFAQGLVAGSNAAGGVAEFSGFPPSTRLKVLEVDLFSIGMFQPTDASCTVTEDSDRGVYRRLVTHDGKLVGANLYGDTTLSGPIKEAIEAGTPIEQLTELIEAVPALKKFGSSL